MGSSTFQPANPGVVIAMTLFWLAAQAALWRTASQRVEAARG